MSKLSLKKMAVTLRKNRVRAKVIGTSERPRLTVTFSNLHVSAQVVDDSTGTTLLAATTVGTKTKGTLTEKAAFIGKAVGDKAKKAKISKLVLDRNGRRYGPRLSALADALRQEGVEV
jgi:large subunit ribosomal protein L18